MDMVGSRPFTACSRRIFDDCGVVSSGVSWFSMITDAFGWMVLDGCEWFWVLADRFAWFQVAFNDLQFI